jgi:hypothetical protein
MSKTPFRIEAGIPAPGPGPVKKSKYCILDDLEVGQSVLFHNVQVSSNLSPVITVRQGRDGKHFVRRKVDGGVRVWRTA